MQFRTPTTIAVAATTALLLAACSGTTGAGSNPSSSESSGGMSGMSMPASPAASMAAGSFNTQDVKFAQMMTAHHLQAIQMADVILKKTGIDPRVTALATAIKGAQSLEITEMNTWLTSWGSKPVTDSMAGMSMGSGSGMMSMDDMTALGTASGAQASKLFLTGMITHHTGAIAMAKTEISTGKSADAITLAKNITTSQTAQIAEMKKLLAAL